MKSEIEDVLVVVEDVKFPVLMESKRGHVILFASRTQGVCVGGRYPTNHILLGEVSYVWNFDLCKPFRGKVILDGSE